jgi:endonuclease VIII
MPEGDTIFRSATTLRPAMEGGVIEDARIRDWQFECERIIGSTVTAVEPRGKHLLMHLSHNPPPSQGREQPSTVAGGDRAQGASPRRGISAVSNATVAQAGAEIQNPSPNLSPRGRGIQIIHSHLGMTGSWHIYRPGEPWRKPTHYAALILSINTLEVICFSPRLLELLTADQLRRHPHIQRLGPDMLGREFDMAAAIQRFRAHNGLPLGEAVLNQTIVCGIGNEYKSDLLFLMGLNPLSAIARFTDDELARMLQKARALMLRNLNGRPRRTRFGSDAGRLWVYGQTGNPCPKCGTRIELQRQGDAGRTTFWCPECQPAR